MHPQLLLSNQHAFYLFSDAPDPKQGLYVRNGSHFVKVLDHIKFGQELKHLHYHFDAFVQRRQALTVDTALHGHTLCLHCSRPTEWELVLPSGEYHVFKRNYGLLVVGNDVHLAISPQNWHNEVHLHSKKANHYHALSGHAQNIVLAYGSSEQEAVKRLKMHMKKRKFPVYKHSSAPHDMDLAYDMAAHSLENLPLFTAEDQLIAVKGLDLLGHRKQVRAVLENHVKDVSHDGYLEGCLEGVFWLFNRWDDVQHVKMNHALMEDRLHTVLGVLMKYHMKKNKITAQTCRYKGASGQTFVLSLFKSLRNATEKEDDDEYDLAKAARRTLKADSSVFLSYYAYPELFDNKKWEQLFLRSLKNNWLRWGGVKDGNSSTFWMNNIAAIAMHRVNSEKFNDYVQQILYASMQNMLSEGIAGHGSSVTDKRNKKPQGASLASAGTFIELVHELGL